ncbi:MAG: ribosomal protein S18-alanine N-acetyltransferase [Lachnospira sp.]|nr:ribosomal protein S18-alanine N-acetyltransferase [Lachnospira sp.]
MESGLFAVRPMREGDIEEVVAIENAIFSIPWSAKSFLDACKEEYNIYLVCEIDGKIAGYCGLWTVMGEGNITNMAVAEEYRKHGIGTALMKAMEMLGQKMDVSIFFLEVRESNVAAQKLYEKMGYREIGRRKRFYEKPVEDALVMSKIYRAE